MGGGLSLTVAALVSREAAVSCYDIGDSAYDTSNEAKITCYD